MDTNSLLRLSDRLNTYQDHTLTEGILQNHKVLAFKKKQGKQTQDLVLFH